VETQIGVFRAKLPSSSGASDDLRSYDLVWLLHLVGDAHQPLHSAERFSKGGKKRPDAGGNLVTINCASGVDCHGADELHAFWDNLLGPSKTTQKAVEKVANALPAAGAALASELDETKWLKDSFDLARSDAYKNPPIDTAK